MSVSTPDPRYFKDGNGLKPRLRFVLHHPRYWLRMKLLWRWRRLTYRHKPVEIVRHDEQRGEG